MELVRLDDLNVTKWQAYLDLVAVNGLMPMLRLATYQDRQRGHWVAPPTDSDSPRYRNVAARYAAFIRELQAQGPIYVVVGNEPNRGDEWGGEPDPAAYTRFLSDVSEALRGDPRILVLNGAMDQYAPNTQGIPLNGFMSIDGASFLERMNAADPDVWSSIDIWASHAYPTGPFESSPSLSEYRVDDVYREGSNGVPPAPGITNRGINSYHSELLLLRQFGVAHIEKVIVTETGWRHRDSQTPSTDTAGATIPARQAAEYIIARFLRRQRLERAGALQLDAVGVGLRCTGSGPLCAGWSPYSVGAHEHAGRRSIGPRAAGEAGVQADAEVVATVPTICEESCAHRNGGAQCPSMTVV